MVRGLLARLFGSRRDPAEAARDAFLFLLTNPTAEASVAAPHRALVGAVWAGEDWDQHAAFADLMAEFIDGDLSALPLEAWGPIKHRLWALRIVGGPLWPSLHTLREHLDRLLPACPIALDVAASPMELGRLRLRAALGNAASVEAAAWIAAQPRLQRAGWVRFWLEALHCWPDAEGPKPKRPAAFRKQAEDAIAQIGADSFVERACWFLSAWTSADAGCGESLTAGMLLVAPVLDSRLIAPIARVVEQSYRDFSNDSIGAQAMRALLAFPDDQGLPALVNARMNKRGGHHRRSVQLRKLSLERGVPLDDLLDVGSPDLGLNARCELHRSVGDYTATVAPRTSRQAALTWRDLRGKSLKATPALLRQQHGEACKALQQSAKDLTAALLGRIAQLEAGYLTRRSLALDRFQARLRAQPIESYLASRLIWRATWGDESCSFMPGEALEDVAGSRLMLPPESLITLWHPLHGGPGEVAAWRDRIERLGVPQPFKQAHRETYVLTDAERATATYSNRFAAHILRQHQFARLFGQRGWRYGLQGDHDSWNEAELDLPSFGLMAKLRLDPVESEGTIGPGKYLYVTTDRVSFSAYDTPLTAIPPVVFSEVMRQVDLAVSVASVGNDPTWVDSGPDGFGAGYRQQLFALPLGPSGEARRQLLATLLPRLSVKDRLALDERWLHVRGTRARYRIHLQSLQVEVADSGRHLCIVPRAQAPRATLPFEGDEVLELLLSKAFLLLEDDRIADAGIDRQIAQALHGLPAS